MFVQEYEKIKDKIAIFHERVIKIKFPRIWTKKKNRQKNILVFRFWKKMNFIFSDFFIFSKFEIFHILRG